MSGLAKLLILIGFVIVALGLVMLLISKLLPDRGGLLPGDIVIRRGNWTFFFPVVTSIIISIILSLILYLLAVRR